MVRKYLALFIPWLAGASICLGRTEVAVAQPSSEPYVSLGTGVRMQQILSREPSPSPVPGIASGWQFDPGFTAHPSIGAGLAQTASKETAVPPAEHARTYPVFFDWDRTDLSARARQIIAAAVIASSQFRIMRIEISGYTDPSGGAQYNKRLSLQRGKSVQAELLGDGVPLDEIEVTAPSTKNPLPPTEITQRGRRIEIVPR